MLESICEMVDLRFQIRDGFSEGAYSLTATAIKRKTNMEITYADIKALMDTLQQYVLEPDEWDRIIAKNELMEQFCGRTL
ncbi:hypothetical protein B0T24DRAFT_683464 [Lasiosphaeria ovina]|uniref:Uncharacterized protein n=1 Tax=Lasiosphaeria ovina TaxID=92902 RepID=A0AAE0MZN4_9PEZI|nr:hypothetical protein B0T24DRAFT_683464 [Lasiosphaeria ovina]